jgi:hypothetical protein
MELHQLKNITRYYRNKVLASSAEKLPEFKSSGTSGPT